LQLPVLFGRPEGCGHLCAGVQSRSLQRLKDSGAYVNRDRPNFSRILLYCASRLPGQRQRRLRSRLRLDCTARS
jgi:hypothetical protein